MGLPNATAILSTLPNGMRVAVSRDSTVASLAVRTAINEAGQISLGGLDRLVRNNIWTICSEFVPRIAPGDVLMVAGVPAIVVDAMTTCGAIVNRAAVLLCEDTVTVIDVDVTCHIGQLAEDVDAALGGFTPNDVQGFFVAESMLPDGTEILINTPVTISGEHMLVEKVSRDYRHGLLCVTCRRRGDA